MVYSSSACLAVVGHSNVHQLLVSQNLVSYDIEIYTSDRPKKHPQTLSKGLRGNHLQHCSLGARTAVPTLVIDSVIIEVCFIVQSCSTVSLSNTFQSIFHQAVFIEMSCGTRIRFTTKNLVIKSRNDTIINPKNFNSGPKSADPRLLP